MALSAMPPHAPRASMPSRAFLFAACVLLLAALSCFPTPALGSSLLLGGGGFVLSRPLLLEGVNVGAVLSAMQEDIAELKRRNTQLQTDLTAANLKITELQQNDARQDSSLALHGAQLTELQQSVSGNASALAALTVRVSSAEATVADHAGRLTTAEGNLTNHAARLISAEASVEDHETRLTTAEAVVVSQGDRLSAAESNVTSQGTRISAVESGLAALSDLMATGSPLLDAVALLQSTVTTQGGRLSQAETNITALATRVVAAEDLDGVPTLLTTTVKAMRDLIGDSTLVTTVLGLRDSTGDSTLVTTVGGLRNTSSALIQSLPCYGETNSSAWGVYHSIIQDGIYVNVSMAACGFTSPPRHVSTSLHGITNNWLTLGPSSVYKLTATSFSIYILPLYPDANGTMLVRSYTPEEAALWNWRINWMATR